MRKVLIQCMTDLTQLFRQSLLLIVMLLYLVSLLSVYFSPIDSGPIHDLYLVKTFVMPFSTCLSILLGIYLYRSYKTNWLNAYPLSYTWSLTGKWLSGLIYMSTYTILSVIIFTWSAYTWGLHGHALWVVLPYLALGMEIIYGLGISFGLLLASFNRLTVAYIVGFLIWVILTYLAPLKISNPSYLLPFDLHPLINALQNMGIEWGFVLGLDEQIKVYWVLISFIFLFMAITIFISTKGRPTQYPLFSFLTIPVALALVIFILFYHVQFWSEQMSDLKTHQSMTSKDLNDDTPNMTAEDYKIDIFKADDQWTFYSEIKVNIPDVLSVGKTTFTINPDYSVEQVTVNGKIIDFEQHHGWIDLVSNQFDPTHSEQTLTFVYSGKLNEWGMDEKTGKEKWFAFTKGDHYYLPANLAWYPLPGHIPIYTKNSKPMYSINPKSAWTGKPVSYTVQMHHFKKQVFTTSYIDQERENNIQKFTISNQTGVTLFGGSFKTWESTHVEAVLPSYYDLIRPLFTSEIGSIRYFLVDTFKKSMDGKFICLPLNDKELNLSEPDVFVLPCSQLNHLSKTPQRLVIDKEIMDQMLTGGHLNDSEKQRKNQYNEDYLQTLIEVYQFEKTGSVITKSKKKPDRLMEKVMAELNHDHINKLKNFLRR